MRSTRFPPAPSESPKASWSIFLRIQARPGVFLSNACLNPTGRPYMTDDRLIQLYRTYGSVIYDRCRSMLDDAAEAEDATHEAFMRLHRHLANLPSAEEAVFWIYRVATNHCLNEIRNRKRRPRPTATLPEVEPSFTDDPELPISDRDLACRLIDAAPAKVRSAAWLYHVDGFQQDEVARILNISRRTVVARLSRFGASARKYLRSNGL